MPSLLPPSDGGSILGDILGEPDGTSALLQETGRQVTPVLDVEDATRVVSSLTLALGIVFLVTTASLYGFYYSTTFDFTGVTARSLSSGGGKDTQRSDSPTTFQPILEDIETSFLRWGVPSDDEEGCRRKIFCESFLQKSSNLTNTTVVRKISETLRDALKLYKSSNNAENPEPQNFQRVKEFLLAADTGLKNNNCDLFSSFCPNVSLNNLVDSPK